MNDTSNVTFYFIAKLLASFCYSFFFSSLAIVAVTKFNYGASSASSLTATFIALVYFTPMLGGYIGDRYLKFQTLFIIGLLAQISTIFILYLSSDKTMFLLSLSLFPLSSIGSSTALNYFITSSFPSGASKNRVLTFMTTFSGMNAGFFFGYLLCGLLTSDGSIELILKIIMLVQLTLLYLFVRVKNKLPNNTPSLYSPSTGVFMIVCGFIVCFTFIRYLIASKILIISLALLMYVLIYKKSSHSRRESSKIIYYFSFAILSSLFWSTYMLTPTYFMLVAKANGVHMFGHYIPAQWLILVDPAIIVLFSPLIAKALKSRSNFKADEATLFSIGLTFSLFAVLSIYLLGLITFNTHFNAAYLLISISLLSIAECFIGPPGSALAGRFAPSDQKGTMIGLWMVNLSVGSLLAGQLANYLLDIKFNNFSESSGVFIYLSIIPLFALIFSAALKAKIGTHNG